MLPTDATDHSGAPGVGGHFLRLHHVPRGGRQPPPSFKPKRCHILPPGPALPEGWGRASLTGDRWTQLSQHSHLRGGIAVTPHSVSILGPWEALSHQ